MAKVKPVAQMSRAQRAQQIWSLLAWAAISRQTLTYDIVARLTGLPKQGVGDCLRPIQNYCLAKRLPALTSVVVNEATGGPSPGFIASADIPGTHRDVWKYQWLKEKAPTTAEFAAAYATAPLRRSKMNRNSRSTGTSAVSLHEFFARRWSLKSRMAQAAFALSR